MAKAETTTENAAPASKKKLLIIIIAAVLLLVVGAGAALLLLGGKNEAHEGEDEEGETAVVDEQVLYERLETFTVNLADQESYLQVEISLKLTDPKVQERIKLRMPELRDTVLRLLSSKTAEELLTPEGKANLAGEIRQEANKVLGVKKESQGVRDVLFLSFIVQ